MNEQDDSQAIAIQRPTTKDPVAWKAYWEKQGQTWRTEPEIGTEKQRYLDELRTTTPIIEQGIYPLKDVKLSRADLEWLLATQDNGQGPVSRNDENWWKRAGLDLRGADLQAVNLGELPLAQLNGGLSGKEWENATEEQRASAGIHLVGANLCKTHLEGAKLSNAHMESANLSLANLDFADLREAFFDSHSKLNNIILGVGKYGTTFLSSVHWGGADLSVIDWSLLNILGEEFEAQRIIDDNGRKKRATTQIKQYRNAVRAYDQLAQVLKEQGLHEYAAQFSYRRNVAQRKIRLHQLLQRSEDSETVFMQIGGCIFVVLYFSILVLGLLKGTGLLRITGHFNDIVGILLLPILVVMALLMAGAALRWTMELERRGNFLGLAYSLQLLGGIFLLFFPLILPIVYLPPILVSFASWTGANDLEARLIQILVSILCLAGLLLLIRLNRPSSRSSTSPPHWLTAVFSSFHEYFQNLYSYVEYFFSFLLDVLVGYGYKPGRTIMAYIIVIVGFDIAYYSIGQSIGPTFNPVGSLVFSIVSFHGRGFFPGGTAVSNIPLDHPITVSAAFEAVIGLFIEASFIAAFIQRFFGK